MASEADIKAAEENEDLYNTGTFFQPVNFRKMTRIQRLSYLVSYEDALV
jgi:hypothetical protein